MLYSETWNQEPTTERTEIDYDRTVPDKSHKFDGATNIGDGWFTFNSELSKQHKPQANAASMDTGFIDGTTINDENITTPNSQYNDTEIGKKSRTAKNTKNITQANLDKFIDRNTKLKLGTDTLDSTGRHKAQSSERTLSRGGHGPDDEIRSIIAINRDEHTTGVHCIQPNSEDIVTPVTLGSTQANARNRAQATLKQPFGYDRCSSADILTTNPSMHENISKLKGTYNLLEEMN